MCPFCFYNYVFIIMFHLLHDRKSLEIRQLVFPVDKNPEIDSLSRGNARGRFQNIEFILSGLVRSMRRSCASRTLAENRSGLFGREYRSIQVPSTTLRVFVNHRRFKRVRLSFSSKYSSGI